MKQYKISLNILFISIIGVLSLSCEKESDFARANDFISDHLKLKFYDSLNIKSIGFIINSQQSNPQANFYYYNKLKKISYNRFNIEEVYSYDSISGKVRLYENFIRSGNNLYENERIVFDQKGNIDFGESRFLSVSFSKDTIEQNESFILTIEQKNLKNSRNNNKVIKKLFIGDFDNNFNILNTETLKSFTFENSSIRIPLLLNTLGNNFIKGFLLEKTITSDSTTTISTIYFSAPIYVKSNTIIPHPYTLNSFRFYDSLASN